MKRAIIALDVLWLIITISLILMAIYVDSALALVFSIFFFGASYFFSGLSSMGGRSGNPYKGMMLSPQPNEIEYSTYKMEYEMNRKTAQNSGVNWLIMVLGIIPLIISFYLVFTA